MWRHLMVFFTFLKGLHTVFRSCCTSLLSQEHCTSVPFVPRPQQQLLLLVFFIIVLLTDVRYISLWFWFAFPWQLHSSHTKECSKFSKPGFRNTWTVNFQMFKLVLEKAEEPEIKLPTSAGSSRKQESSRKKYLFLLYWLCQSLWLCGSQ